MSSIFISYSSEDHAFAQELLRQLKERGYSSVFLDFDPKDGIPPGRNWEDELYHKLKVCRALIVLCSERSMSSRWCFAEVTQAKSLGKPVFPVKIAPCMIDPVLTDRQILDLTTDEEQAGERLWRGLERAGLDPSLILPPDRPPYPGLTPFQEADAAVFFGREEEIGHALDTLSRMRLRGEPRLAVVLGASGCGKSSLVRAGVIPRLRKDTERWIIVPPFRPGDRPQDELARALAEAFRAHGERKEWTKIRDSISAASDRPADDVAKKLTDLAKSLGLQADRREASVLLVLDQFEDLLDPQANQNTQAMLALLRATLRIGGRSLLFLATLRSDFLGALQTHSKLQGILFEGLPLGPLPVEKLARVIEGPAEVTGIDFDPGLVQRMVSDTATDDALPLLAFTLRQMWERCGNDFKLEVYERHLGNIKGAVARIADEIAGGTRLTQEGAQALRLAFRMMVRINEEGRFVRRVARWQELPEDAHPLLEEFVESRLVVSRSEDGQRVVEVAHEALFRVWERLASWLREEQGFLLAMRRFRSAHEEWKRTGMARENLLRGRFLNEVRDWLSGDTDFEEDERGYIRQSLRTRTRRRMALVSGIVLLLAILGLGVRIYMQAPGHAWMPTAVTTEDVKSAAFGQDDRGRLRVVYVEDIDLYQPDPYDYETWTTSYVIAELSDVGQIIGATSYRVVTEVDPINDEVKAESSSRLRGTDSLELLTRTLNKEFSELYGDTESGPSAEDICSRFLPPGNSLFRLVLRDGQWRPEPPPEQRSEPLAEQQGLIASLQKGPETSEAPKGALRMFLKTGEIRAYRTGAQTVVAFADGRASRILYVTVPLLSSDSGRTWVAAGYTELIRTPAITSVVVASADGQLLYVSAQDYYDHGYASLPGGLFKSEDGGASWSKIDLPWSSCSSVCVWPGRSDTLLVALAPGSRYPPDGVPGVVISRDGGETWNDLNTGLQLSTKTSIRILGVTHSGTIFAFSNSGTLAVWRRLGVLERLRGAFGVRI